MLIRRALAAVGTLLAAACVAPSTRAPEEVEPPLRAMSAAEHRREAAALERRAAELESGEASAQSRIRVGFPVVGNINRDPQEAAEMAEQGASSFDPGVVRDSSARARAERDRARAHLAAAEALERATARACEGIAHDSREDCPLRGVAGVEPVEGGARISLSPGVDLDHVLDHALCAMAVAREHNYQTGHACPLHLPGIDVEPDPAAHALVVRGRDAKAIRARAARLLRQRR